ncbi:MAG: bifunctional 5,10-methylenetetrahydrofolate dehydrogenase/5,10-methenyltetrahydrofolate cyclohydrolase [Desulfovibrionaceae bacterium]
MTGYILDGFSVAEQEIIKIAEEIVLYPDVRPPKIVVILVGNDIASSVYVQYKVKACARVGIDSIVLQYEDTISQEYLKKVINEFNNDSTLDAILLQLPLPKHLNAQDAIRTIDPQKDVDCLHPFNIGLLVHSLAYITPCTPSGILKLLQYYEIGIQSSHIVVIGRSLIVGKPFALLALQHNATVTLCHSYTNSIKQFTRHADILIVAVGKAHFLTQDMVKEGAVVVDVGINRKEGKLVGDTDFEKLLPKVSAITPVPKGIGPMTIAQLLQNTLLLWKRNLYLE